MYSNSDCRSTKIQVLLVFVLLFFGVTAAVAQTNDVQLVTGVYAIENARIVQAPGQVIESGTVVLRDGLIEAVGTDVDIPYDAEIIEGDSLTIYAGFIDGLSQAGVPRPRNAEGGATTRASVRASLPEGFTRANPPNDVAGVQPERSVVELLDPKEKSIADLREVGFTVAHVVPRGQMLPGSGAIILLGEGERESLVLRPDVSIFAQMQGARGVYPGTPMGVMAKMRQIYKEAQRRKRMEALYEADATAISRPAYDPVHYAFFPVIDGQKPIVYHVNGPLEIYRALRLQKALGFPLVLTGLYEGFESIDALAEANMPMFITFKMPKEDKKSEALSDSLTYDPDFRLASYEGVEAEKNNLELRKEAFRQQYLAMAGELENAGLEFGFTTMDVKESDIHKNLRTMVANGLSEEVALAALTTQAAANLGLSNNMGTVETGKMANLVLMTGSLFEEASKVKHVFVDGKKFSYDTAERPAGSQTASANPIGTWSYTIAEANTSGTMTVSGTPDNLSGTIEVDGMASAEMSNVELSGNELSFTFTLAQFGTISAMLVLDEDEIEGMLNVPQMGDASVEGERISGPSSSP